MSREPQLASVEMLTVVTGGTTNYPAPRTTTDFTYPSTEVGLLPITTTVRTVQAKRVWPPPAWASPITTPC